MNRIKTDSATTKKSDNSSINIHFKHIKKPKIIRYEPTSNNRRDPKHTMFYTKSYRVPVRGHLRIQSLCKNINKDREQFLRELRDNSNDQVTDAVDNNSNDHATDTADNNSNDQATDAVDDNNSNDQATDAAKRPNI